MATEERQIDQADKFPPITGQVFNDFKLEECLKRSSDCAVFVCHHINDNSLKFVAKIGLKREAKKLSGEIICYEELVGGEGIPQLIYHKRFVKKRWVHSKEEWVEDDWAMLVIEKLRPKFAKTTHRFNKDSNLTLEELVPMAVQQISLLEFIHSRGLIHKGVKPDNFVVSEDESKVYIIDFNKSKRYLRSDGNHVDFQKDDKLAKGLPLFHSLNYHNGIRCSRRDDMESLGFCWIYLLKGSLPWSLLKSEGKYWPKYVRDVGQRVAETTFEELCRGLPGSSSKYFVEYFKICRNLGFYDEPNYEALRQLITSSLSDSNNNDCN